MIHRRTLLTGVAGTSALGLVGCGRAGHEEAPARPSSSSRAAGVGDLEPRVTEVIAEGLNVPWGIAFLPDGRALVAQRDAGTIVVVDATAPTKHRVRHLGQVAGIVSRSGGEGGLLGLALDPEDPSSLYAYVTTAADDRIVRISLADGRIGDTESVLTGVPVGDRHHGGRIVFGPDGHLYVGTGEAERSELAQDKESLGGKILRLDRNGEVEQWSLGHRNVEGLAFDAAGRLWETEFGSHRFDELNLISQGGNYGWPVVEGDSVDNRFVTPKVTWTPAECSPAGVAITQSTAFIAALRGERLWAVPLDGKRVGEPRDYFVGAYGRLRTVAVAPNGDLWLTTSNTDGRGHATSSDDRVLRVAVGAR